MIHTYWVKKLTAVHGCLAAQIKGEANSSYSCGLANMWQNNPDHGRGLLQGSDSFYREDIGGKRVNVNGRITKSENNLLRNLFFSYRSECHIVIKLNNLCDYTSHICYFHPRLTFRIRLRALIFSFLIFFCLC